MKWIWIRHGETEANRLRQYVGHTDVELNGNGLIQVNRLRDKLAHESPVAIFTSDLLRCKETAHLISLPWQLKPIEVPALRELSFGQWEQKTYEEIMQADPVKVREWYDNFYDLSPPDGESVRQMGQRVDKWLQWLFASCDKGKTIFLVSHGGVIRWFQSTWIHRDASLFWQVEGVRHGQAFAAEWNGENWKGTLIG